MIIRLSLALSLVVCGLVACTTTTSPQGEEAAVAETDTSALQLVACRDDSERVACFDGYASNGYRCTTSRDCPEGTVCRSTDRFGGAHCFYVAPEPNRPDGTCPRGSVGGMVACAPGFEATVVSREPHCESCEAGADIARRCRAAGLTADRCRAILNDHRDDGVNIPARCRAAGLTPTDCRRLVSDDPARDDSPIRGDLDGNRTVDDEDVRRLDAQRGPTRDATRADVNGDRVVDDADGRIQRDNRGDWR